MKFLFSKITASTKNFWLYTLLFSIVFCLISFVNNYNFNTHTLDLGLYTNACYQYIHFGLANLNMIQTTQELLLSDHFDLYLIIFSPLIYIFQSYTLLVVQLAAVIVGAIAIKKIAVENFKVPHLLPVFHYYGFFGLYAALSFEYHSNVVAACILPWFIYFFINKKIRQTFLVFVFLLISKENFSLFLAFVSLGLGFKMRKEGMMKWGALLFILSAVYFVSIVQFVMPALSNSGFYRHFDYRVLGQNMPEAVKTIITEPWHTIKYLFCNQTGLDINNYLKLETHIFLLLSGVLILFYRPIYLFMLLPIYFQKMFHNDPLMWGPYYQYNIEFLPIVIFGSIDIITSIKNKQNIIYLVVVCFTFIVTIRLMDRTRNYYNKSAIRFYQPKHYKKDYNVASLKKVLNEIPSDASVSAQSPFVPYLCLRKTIYNYPIVFDSQYIVLTYKESPYPVDTAEFNRVSSDIINSKSFEVIYNVDSVFVIRRK